MANPYYDHGSFPATGSTGSSASMRAEFDAVEAGFDKLPTLSGYANKAVVVNGSGTALTTTSGSMSLAGDLTLAGALTTSGAYGLTFTLSALTSLTLPTTGTLATLAGTETLTNKTLNLASNTLTGTIAQFNAACSDADFATLAGTETLTNKTLNLESNTLTGTIAQFNTACSDADFATLAGTETLTDKTLNLTSNTLRGTIAQFNTACSDADFATLAGTETLTNKTLGATVISGEVTNSATSSLQVPAGTTAQRPTGATGKIRYNSDLSRYEGYGASSWDLLGGKYLVQAWVNFNGVGTVAIGASGNVSSITDNGVGDYTVTFTNALSDTNYGFAGAAEGEGGPISNRIVASKNGARLAGSLNVYVSDGIGTKVDVPSVSIMIIR